MNVNGQVQPSLPVITGQDMLNTIDQDEISAKMKPTNFSMHKMAGIKKERNFI